MKKRLVILVFFACCAGCNSGNESARQGTTAKSSSQDSTDGVSTAEKAISTIHVGTSEPDLLAAMNPNSIDSGTVYWGGTGARRMYFHIARDKQVWFELSGPAGGNQVIEIGHIEPKTNWTRHDGDSITVDQIAN